MISQPVVGTVFCMCCTVTGGRDSPSSSSTAGVCCGSRDGGTIWKLLCCSAVMDHAAGMSVALDFVIVHQAWVCVRIHSAPSIKRCCCARLPRKLMGCLYDASSTMFYSEELLLSPLPPFPIQYFNSVLLK